jgi:predicted MFS family arabinose efflux permease
MNSSRRIAWSAWAVVSTFYAYQYILRVMPSILLDDIMAQFNIDAAVFGQFSGLYYIGYSLMHIPLGILLSRYNSRLIITWCILVTVIGTLPILFCTHWIYLIIGRTLVGMGSSGAILGVFNVVRNSFPEKHFSRMLSLSVTIGLLGAIYGGSPVGYLCSSFGYQGVVKAFSLVGLALALFAYLMLPKNKIEKVTSSIWGDVREVFFNGRVLALCFFSGLMVGPLEGFADIWGPQYLKHVYGFETGLSASLPSMIFMGMCFGSPILSLIAEKTNYYLGSIAGAGLIMASVFAALIFQSLTPQIMGITFVLVGICCSYQILTVYMASCYVEKRVAELAGAAANMIIMSFGYFFHTIIGLVLTELGGKEAPHAFTYAMAIIPLGLIMGVLGVWALSYKQRPYSTPSVF